MPPELVSSVESRKTGFPEIQEDCQFKFSVTFSTEHHFRCPDDEPPRFYGAYGHIRKQLDYSYHVHYRKERQWLHDSIIEDYLENVEDNQPENVCDVGTIWLILTAGVKGAGKHHAIRKLIATGHLPLISYVHVDQDGLGRSLPEYEEYLEHAPELAGEMTTKEAGYIAETLCIGGLRMGKTVVWDSSLGDPEWYATKIQQLRKSFPCLKVALFHLTAETETINRRCRMESELTGRTIPPSFIGETMARLPSCVERVAKEAEFSCRIRNDDDDTLEIEGGKDFHDLSAAFALTCPIAKPAKPVRRVSEELPDMRASLQRHVMPSFRRRKSRRRFSVLLSTELNHKTDDMSFYGRFAHIRSTLDYSYHHNYTFERQKFQDTIMLEFLTSAVIQDKNGEVCTTPTEPVLCFTAGAMGAGKSYTMRKLVDNGRFPLLAFVNVDPDEIRRKLPEYHLYVTMNPELAGDLTRKEAGFVAEILSLAALEAGKNVLVDGSLRDSDWYQEYFKRLRQEFPVVRLAIIHVSAPREAVFERAAQRAKETGRVVPMDLLEQALEQVPRSVKLLAPLVDYCAELLNAPNAKDIELVTEGETWETFYSQWVQTCAWVPKKKRNQEKLRLKASSYLSTVSEASFSESANDESQSSCN